MTKTIIKATIPLLTQTHTSPIQPFPTDSTQAHRKTEAPDKKDSKTPPFKHATARTVHYHSVVLLKLWVFD